MADIQDALIAEQDPSETEVTAALDAAPAAEPAPVGADQQLAPTAPAHSFESVWAEVMSGWLVNHVANSPISRETAAFNHLVETALPALRQAILEKI